MTLPIEPDKEREADHWSLSLLAKAGYDPHAALTAARRLAGRGDRGARHLGGAERLAALRDLLADVPRQGQRDSSEFRELQQSLGAVP